MTYELTLPLLVGTARRSDSMSKVLIIDDDLTAREVLGARLESLGHAVFLEADGVAGLEACRLRRPEVVLLDLRLPDCDGLEILAQLKEQCPETEVIILTAYATVIMQSWPPNRVPMIT